MKVCLALAFQSEAPWLRLHLPVWANSGAFDGIVALDGGSTDDSAAVVRSLGGTVYERPFDWDFGAHMNALLTHCEELGFEAVMRMDPDEVMFPEAMRAIRGSLETFKALRFPRMTFEGDRQHILPFMFPDYQTRAFHLNAGVRYCGTVHETVEESMRAAGWIERGDDNPYAHRDIMRMPHLTLFHYEGLRTDERRALKHLNYFLLSEGRPVVEQYPVPFDGSGPYRYCVPFVGAQPLDPEVIGVRAPFDEVTA